MPLSQLVDRHRAILRMHQDVIDAADRLPIGEELPRARRALGSAVIEYLALKHAMVITPLRDSSDPDHQAMARRCIEDDLAARQESMEHYRIWTMQAIEDNPREFRMVVRQMTRKLERRIQHEELVVHQMVRQRLGGASAAAA